jgi:hypothetical protein
MTSVEHAPEQGTASRGSARVVYLGPVAPHWEVEIESGDPVLMEAFRDRTLARLTLLVPDDPQFRRNRERVRRDAEREGISLAWEPPEYFEEPSA